MKGSRGSSTNTPHFRNPGENFRPTGRPRSHGPRNPFGAECGELAEALFRTY